MLQKDRSGLSTDIPHRKEAVMALLFHSYFLAGTYVCALYTVEPL